uniref:Uncharacterized protein n=1 Tax=Panagrolaimus davidi TaxID=227884 RepID=A0A914Q894_9BILA
MNRRKCLLRKAGGKVEKPNAPIDIQMRDAKLAKVKRLQMHEANIEEDDGSDAPVKHEQESEVDEDEEEVEFDPNDVVVNQAVEKDLKKFLEPGEGWTVYDLVRQKILEKNSNLIPLGDRQDSNIPPEAVRLYNEVGHILSRYCTGKIPVAFKNLRIATT